MHKFYKGQKFGNWEVINLDREYIQEPLHKKKII